MSAEQIMEACSPVFAAFCDVGGIKWDQYAAALQDVNPGDLDDALGEIRKTHGFRNAPLPADILRFCDSAKRKRIASRYRPEREPAIDPNAGELRELTVKGIGMLKLRVLPDEHPALRVSCLRCGDSGWRDVPHSPDVQRTVKRCDCWKTNPVLQREREQNARFIKERQS